MMRILNQRDDSGSSRKDKCPTHVIAGRLDLIYAVQTNTYLRCLQYICRRMASYAATYPRAFLLGMGLSITVNNDAVWRFDNTLPP